jgi:hypothetical protein
MNLLAHPHLLAEGFQLPTDKGTWIAIAGALAMMYVFLKARRKPTKNTLGTQTPYANLATQKRVENQMTELVVELEKMARQITAQLDTRAARLEALITQADERVELLKSLTSGPRFAEGIQQDDQEPQPPDPIPIDPRHSAVYSLADQGRSPMEISKEVGQPAGEVELILALRRRAR